MVSAASGEAARQVRDLFGGSVVGMGDDKLLARYAATRDGAAFEALVLRHGPMVLATCRSVLRDEHDAEDAFQATFLALSLKAGSVRAGVALGGWLHRVARRAAVQAGIRARRRIRVEAEAATPAESHPVPDPELRPILHEEIGRLPERHRLPVILCDLEGLTYEQAAERLRWTEPTLRCRLARARQGLRRRLIRRGITAPAAAALLAASATSASAVSPVLTRAAVATALGGAAPATVARFTRIILKGMLMTRIKIATTAALAAVALTTAGVMAARGGRPDVPKVDPENPPPAGAAASQPGGAGELLRVVDPDGKPVAGARVFRSDIEFRRFDPGPPAVAMPLAETGPDGTFRLAPGDSRAAQDRKRQILARAEGFGPALADPSTGDGMKVLRLAKDDVPIRGRVLDADGRPVAGATIQLVGILWHPSGQLDEWLAALAEEKVAYPVEYRLLRSWASDDLPSLYPPVATDRDGRFTIRGLGRERVASLLISGPGIETRFEYVATRDMPTQRFPDFERQNQGHEVTYHGASFDLVAGPGLEVVGTVRDKDTGHPLGGAIVQTTAPFGNPLRFLRATADAEGRYRLPGIPPQTNFGDGQAVLASVKGGPAYLPSSQSIGRDRGTVTRNFALKRGAWATGQITDGTTGQPVRASLDYFIPQDNPHIKDYPRYETIRVGMPFHADDDGRFRIAVMPGPGILGARLGNETYRLGVGIDKIPGLKAVNRGLFGTLPMLMIPRNYNTLVAIDPRPEDESVEVDIVFDRGRTLKGTVVGPDGQPVAGALMMGAEDFVQRWSDEPLPSAEFEVHALGGGLRRGLLFYHEGRQLAGSYVVGPEEPGPAIVTLKPCGVVSGRLIDDDGRPRAGVPMTCDQGFGGEGSPFDKGSLPSPIKTDAEGRFRASGLVPGLKYSLRVWSGREIAGEAVRDVITQPGESKDLGDVKLLATIPRGD